MPKTHPSRFQGAGIQLCLVLPRLCTTLPNSPLAPRKSPPSPGPRASPKEAADSRSCLLLRPAPATAQLPLRSSLFPPPTVLRPGSHLSTHSLRKRISSVCRMLGSCLHIFTKARSSLTLRGSMPGSGGTQQAQLRLLTRRDRVEGGGCREAEQTRTSPAAGSAHQRSRDPGSWACSFPLSHLYFCALVRTF